MDLNLKEKFIKLWNQYFPSADLPITFYYTDEEERAEKAQKAERFRCFVTNMAKVRNGKSLCFSKETVKCFGAKRYLGFSRMKMPFFSRFLSCGIPFVFKGERYKKDPKTAKAIIKDQPPCRADGKYIVFKRWDMLEEQDDPAVVVFFADPDVLSGLFTLVNYDAVETNAVYAPFSSGCSTIVHYPYNDYINGNGRAVLGMFDVTARTYVKPDVLTLAMPMPKFTCMVNNIEGSFLEMPDWSRVQTRIGKK